MSKQVELKGDNLIVHTREDYNAARKIIVLAQGKTAKVFYPSRPAYIDDLEEIKAWNVCGFPVSELYKLALILKESHLELEDLKDYNLTYMAGYQKANEEALEAIKKSIDRLMGDL